MKKHKQLKVLICIILLLSFLASSAVAFAASKPVLRKGMKSEAVKTLQKNLKKLGFFNTEPTGYFGEITLQQSRSFRRNTTYPPPASLPP